MTDCPQQPPTSTENVSMDAQVQVNQNRLTRDDELRISALNIATRDRFHFSKELGEPVSERALADAKAYYAWFTETDNTEGAPTA